MTEISQRPKTNFADPRGDAIANSLTELLHQVSQGATLDTVLNSIYDGFKPFLPFNRIACALIDESGERAVLRWCRSDRPVFLKKDFSASLEKSSLQFILEQRRPRILNNLEEYLKSHPDSGSTRLIVNEGLRSSFTFPLIVEGRGIGFLFFSSAEANAYSNDHFALFDEIARLLSLSILIASQRDRSTKSQDGYVDLLDALLRSVNPRSERVVQLVSDVAQVLSPEHVRHYAIAAMLTEVSDVISKNDNKEQGLVSSIVSRIGELNFVSKMIVLHEKQSDILSPKYGDLRDEPLELGANIIRTVRQFKDFELVFSSIQLALEHLRRQPEMFAPFVVNELERTLLNPADLTVRRVTIKELVDGMVFKEHVFSSNGSILLSNNHVVDKRIRRQLEKFASTGDGVKEPLLVAYQPDEKIVRE